MVSLNQIAAAIENGVTNAAEAFSNVPLLQSLAGNGASPAAKAQPKPTTLAEQLSALDPNGVIPSDVKKAALDPQDPANAKMVVDFLDKAGFAQLDPKVYNLAKSYLSTDTKTETAAKKADSTPTSGEVSTEENKLIGDADTQLANNIWTQLGDAIVNQQKQQDQIIGAGISGQDTAKNEATAMATALGSLGLSPNSGASDWLKNQIATANKNDSPIAQAMQAYGATWSQGQDAINQALTNMGEANALTIETAPEQSWIQNIAQHLQSNINYSGVIPPQIADTLPAAIKHYLAISGGGYTTPGGVPLTSLDPTISGASKLPSVTKASSGAQGGGTGGNVASDVGSAPG